MKRLMMLASIIPLMVFAQVDIEGEWEGTIDISGTELGMIVRFATVEEDLTASIDIPMQGAYGLLLENVSCEDSKVHFELDAGPSTAIFDGELEDGKIAGDFKQGPAIGTFYLERLCEVEIPPPDYNQEEVSIVVNDEVTLAGTLSTPFEEGPYPAVILITGSGAQDRDEDIFGFSIFYDITDYLTPLGIAVLRCDDRGVAASTGDRDSATSADFADDVEAQVDFLKTRQEIDKGRIGLLGHSEGGLIAGMVAADNPDIEFAILMAAPGLPGDTVLNSQLIRVLEAEGLTEAEIAGQRALQAKLLKYSLDGEDEEELRAELTEIADTTFKKEMTEEQLAEIEDFDAFVEQRVNAQMETVRTPWFRFFLAYDPREDLARVDARVLAFFGGKDVQAVAEVNAPAMDELFTSIGKDNYYIHICDKANHLFQPANTGAVSEYAELPKEFVPCFLPNVANWILGEAFGECSGECHENPDQHEGCGKSQQQGCGGCPHSQEHNH